MRAQQPGSAPERDPNRLDRRWNRAQPGWRLHQELRLLALAFGLSFGIALIQMASGTLTIVSAIPTLAIGVCVGTLLSRVYRFTWVAEAGGVIGRVDRVGAVVIGCSAVFSLLRMHFLAPWGVDLPPALSEAALMAGVAIGRLAFSLKGVHDTLADRGSAAPPAS